MPIELTFRDRVVEYFGNLLSDGMGRFKFYRRLVGGTWYKHEMTGQLPGCYGSWWSRKEDHHPRFEAIVETEKY